MVADPDATPVTTPVLLTEAREELLLDHVIVWPVITFPCASFTVAVRATVAPTFIEAVEGATVTVVTTGGGGGTAVTDITDVPDFPAHAAVIVADPWATPVTTPAGVTDATDVLLLDQVIVCPLITFPWASFTVAVRVVFAPTFIEAVGGATVTVVTTGGGGGEAVTVMVAVPDFPADDAVIVADPAAAPVTTPVGLTVATAASLVDQVTGCPLITLPLASLTVAVSGTVPDTLIEAAVGATVTEATTGGGGGAAVTVMVAEPDLPAHDAVTVADPPAIPVTMPPVLTAATAGSLVDQVMIWPFITLPPASLTVAWRSAVPLMAIEADDGATVTVVTVGGAGRGGVDAVATLDGPPKVASAFNAPRKGFSWKLYVVPGVRPKMLQVSWVPTPVPATGLAHVPPVAGVAAPHDDIGATAYRTS
jgi:hypothetical protein